MEKAVQMGLLLWDLTPQNAQGVSEGLHKALSTSGIIITGLVYLIRNSY